MYSNVIKRIEDQGFSDSLTVTVVETPQLYLVSLHELHHHTRENTIFKLVNMERHGQAYRITLVHVVQHCSSAAHEIVNWLQSLMGETMFLSIICLLHEAESLYVTGADPGFQKSGGGGGLLNNFISGGGVPLPPSAPLAGAPAF